MLKGIIFLTLVVLTAHTSASSEGGGVDHSEYASLLKGHVDDEGMVDYKKLKAGRHELDSFLKELADVKRKDYESWGNEDKIAFWINAYNALTLKAIVDNYPIKASWLKSRIYPKNSIRQISGVWKELQWNVMGEKVTLEHIEHQFLRKEFDEPRIHMALVCAAMGCPPLRSEPYEGSKLGEQLDHQTSKFLGNPKKLKIDRGKKVVFLSPIFKWFAEDFKKGYGETKIFISRYLDAPDTQYLKKEKYSVRYMKYDWSLNEQ